MGVEDEAGDFVALVGDEWLVEELRERDVGEGHLGGDALLFAVGGEAGQRVAGPGWRGLGHQGLEVFEDDECFRGLFAGRASSVCIQFRRSRASRRLFRNSCYALPKLMQNVSFSWSSPHSPKSSRSPVLPRISLLSAAASSRHSLLASSTAYSQVVIAPSSPKVGSTNPVTAEAPTGGPAIRRLAWCTSSPTRPLPTTSA